jgi:P27 family predicted phage terminase small subunit
MAYRTPAHLSRSMKTWVRSVLKLAGEEITPTDCLLLVKAADAHDRAETARRALKRAGLTTKDRYGGEKPHPCVAIEVASRRDFARLCAQLGLDLHSDSGNEPVQQTYRGANGRVYRSRGA